MRDAPSLNLKPRSAPPVGVLRKGQTMTMSASRVTLFPALVGAALVSASAGQASDITEALRGLAPKRVAESACPTRIINGTCTTQKQWPWQVALYFRDNTGDTYYRCGGSLVAPNKVLTAAHCFQGDGGADPQNWTAVDNVNKLDFSKAPPDATSSTVSRVIVHEQYKGESHENDIAIMELTSPLAGNTITLQTTADPSLEAGRDVTVTGWGVTRWVVRQKDDQGHIFYVDGETKKPVKPADFLSPNLQEATMPLVDIGECEREYQPLNEGVVDERNLCAGLREGGRDSCQGDSGGPLMAKTAAGEWRQIGVVSWGHDCARPGFAGIYTRVSAFGDWVQRNLGVEPAQPHEQQQQQQQTSAATPPQPQPPTQPTQPQQPDTQVPENSAGLTIAFDKGDDVNVGDRVSYVATTQKPGYLAIFDATPDGKLTQIFPNEASLRSPTGALGTTRINPLGAVYVPNYRNPYRGFDVEIEEPRGDGMIVAILSDDPLKSLPTPDAPRSMDKRDALSALARLRAELTSRMIGKRDGFAHPSWSMAAHKYTIH